MSEEQTQVDSTESTEVVPQANDTTQNPVETPEAEVPAYTPNFKFKVHDQEHEFEEAVRPFITNEEMEKKFRDLYERAYGLDQIKPKYEKYKTDYQQLSNNWNTVSQDLQKLGLYLHSKDYANFFKTFNLSDEQIMQYALERLQFHELPPEKRAQIEQQQTQSAEYVRLKQENARLREFYQNQELSQLQGSLNQAISAPDIQTVAASFDARAGKPGAFRESVIHHANVVFSSSGKDMGAQEAVESFINLMGLTSAQPAVPGQMSQGMQTQAPVPQRAQTLPKMQGSGASPVKKTIKSIEELKKIRSQMTE